MKIVVACGGTGGHAFPGLAVAEELVARGHDVTVWNSGRDIESSVMKRWKGSTFSTGARQLSVRNVFAIIRSFFRCRREMKRVKPDVLLAMGSYSSLPPVLAARWRNVPIVLHEANTVPGKAVEFLARFAEIVAISFDVTQKYLPGIKTVKTGLPVRSDISTGKRFDFIPPNAFVIFVTGGSQGAHAVNELLVAAMPMIVKELERDSEARPLYVIHQTGSNDESRVLAAYTAANIPCRVHAFEREMANAFASADVVVARAGASTCFELTACGKPALLIPLPSAMRNHQHFNADAFAATGAADEGVQDKLSAHQLSRYLLNLMRSPTKLESMSAKMKSLSMPDAAARVADVLDQVKKG